MSDLVTRVRYRKTTSQDRELLEGATSSPELVGKSVELSPLEFWQFKIEYALLVNRIDEEFERPLLRVENITYRPYERSRYISIQVVRAYLSAKIGKSLLRKALRKLLNAAEVEPLTRKEKYAIFG